MEQTITLPTGDRTTGNGITRPKEYVKLDWEAIIDRARRANGRWILVANAVPASVLRTIRQKRHRALVRDDGELICRPGETVELEGKKVMDVYAHWRWSDDSYNLLSARSDHPRKVTLPEAVGQHMRAVAGLRGESNAEIIRDALLSYVLHGTRYVKPKTIEFTVNIPDQLWEQARTRAQEEGLKFSRVLEHEVRKQLRKRT